MAYVKPTTAQDAHSVVDGKDKPFGVAVQSTPGGFGVINPNTGDFEVLDALPLNRASVQEAVERGTGLDVGVDDALTAAEIASSAVIDTDSVGGDIVDLT